MRQVGEYMKVRKLDVFIEDIQSAAARASAIIRHMLDFSRAAKSRRTVCDLRAIVDSAVDLASNDYDLKKSYDFKKIEIARDYDEDLPGIGCTTTEIEQVLLNVLRNAAQAMAAADPPPDSPRIAIRIRNLEDRERIEIADNGPGISETVRRRIFEPFFTTKQPGVGTGLGLSVSYFIVTKGHGGRMSVQNGPEGGAIFIIDLPKEGGLEN
jgi:signal transduction histidine kinase